MSVVPPPVRPKVPDPEPSAAPAATVAAGLAVALGCLLVELSGGSPNTPAWVRALEALIDGEDWGPMVIGLFAVGAVVQAWRLRWLRRRGLASVGFRRWLDWALTVLGALALTPTLEPYPTKWVDLWFYAFTVCGGLLVVFSVACVRRKA